MRPDLLALSFFFSGFALVCWVVVLTPRLRGRIGWRGNGTRMSTTSLIAFALLPTTLALASIRIWPRAMLGLCLLALGFLAWSHYRDVVDDRKTRGRG
ncbi:MAG: hypothetical protein U0527_07135 [Candidatus Eisenbacteria bacterium]